MTTLFRIQGSSKSENRTKDLQTARRELIKSGGFKDDTGQTLFSYSHPIFWAPFTVVGDGGEAQAGS